jgi:NADH:ubiquinone oxidoreductase subunit 5 (subunit L)/multisubunit Na+/H+ antiporter MnhA subunit
MDNDQDMRHYGGLQKLMPITSITFIIGWLAIAGVPPFAGFWSKDEILAYAYEENFVLWAIGLLTAVLTAFYMSRQVFMTFFGRYRFADVRPEEIAEVWQGRIAAAATALVEAESGIGSTEDGMAKAEEKLVKAQEKLDQRQNEMAEVDQSDEKAADKATKNLEKAYDGVVKAQTSVDEVVLSVEEARTFVMEARLNVESIAAAAAAGGDDLDGISENDLPDAVRARREYHPHESPWQMTLPLIVLAGAAVVAGAMNLPFSSDLHFLGDWLKPSTFGNEAHLTSGGGTLWVLAVIAVAGGVVGIAAAVAIYLKGRYPAEKVELPILEQAWRYDQTISNFMGGPGRKGFDRVAWFDATFIDGAVNGVGRLVREGGGQLRRLQTGLVRSYAAFVAVGAVGLLAWFLTRTTI